MHHYHRLMRRRGSNAYSEVERLQLLELLEAASGVECVKIIEQHPKGGYRVTFDLSQESIESFIALLDEHDWMSVM